MKIFLFCKQYLLSHKYKLIIFIMLAFLTSLLGILLPYVLGKYLDRLVIGANQIIIINFCLIYGGINALKVVLDYYRAIIYTKMQVQMGYNLNIALIKHIHGLSLSYVNSQDGIYLNQRINGDSYSLITFCLTTLQNIIINLVMFIVPLVAILVNNFKITILLLVFILLYIVLYLALKSWLYESGRAFKESQANFLSKLYEQIKYMKMIKINSIQDEMIYRISKVFFTFKVTAIRSQKANFVYSGLEGIISSLARVFLFVFGGLQVINGRFTIGQFTIFLSYFNMMLNSSRYFFGLGAVYQNTMVSYNRIIDILKREIETNGQQYINDINKIELTDVKFNYNSHIICNSLSYDLYNTNKHGHSNYINLGKLENVGNNIINCLSAKFLKGNIYAIVGPNGVGKSTIIGLIIGLYLNEYYGQVAYNDICIRQLDMIKTRKQLIGFSEQEPLLIGGSIKNNLDYNNLNSIDNENQLFRFCEDSNKPLINQCIKILNMENLLNEYGFSYIINENNGNVSGGEKQKISLFRVLYKDPPVMIFDEPTSALDESTVKNFMDYLQNIKNDKIIIMSTHDDYAINCCDEIIKL